MATIPLDSPSWIARHPSLPVLYAVAELDEGRVHAWALAAECPAEALAAGETGGRRARSPRRRPSGRFLVTANYSGGSIACTSSAQTGASARARIWCSTPGTASTPRQAGPHPHMIRVVERQPARHRPGRRRHLPLPAPADGSSELYDVIAAPAGSGPRHVLPVGDRYYVTAELSGQVLVYDAAWSLSVRCRPARGPARTSRPSWPATAATCTSRTAARIRSPCSRWTARCRGMSPRSRPGTGHGTSPSTATCCMSPASGRTK